MIRKPARSVCKHYTTAAGAPTIPSSGLVAADRADSNDRRVAPSHGYAQNILHCLTKTKKDRALRLCPFPLSTFPERRKNDLLPRSFFLCARCVIFPGRRQPSIVTVNELNYCVRNGNRCTLVTNSTHYLFYRSHTPGSNHLSNLIYAP